MFSLCFDQPWQRFALSDSDCFHCFQKSKFFDYGQDSGERRTGSDVSGRLCCTRKYDVFTFTQHKFAVVATFITGQVSSEAS